MTTPLTTFEQATKLKEAGFDWEVKTHFVVNIPNAKKADKLLCPTLDEAVRWLREVKGIHVGVEPDYVYILGLWNVVLFRKVSTNQYEILDSIDGYNTYNEALSEGINVALLHVKP